MDSKKIFQRNFRKKKSKYLRLFHNFVNNRSHLNSWAHVITLFMINYERKQKIVPGCSCNPQKVGENSSDLVPQWPWHPPLRRQRTHNEYFLRMKAIWTSPEQSTAMFDYFSKNENIRISKWDKNNIFYWEKSCKKWWFIIIK